MIKRIFLILLAVCLLLTGVTYAAEGESKDVSKRAVFKRDGWNKSTVRANDNDMCTRIELEAGEHLTVRAEDKRPLGWLFLRFSGVPAPFSVTELDGAGETLRVNELAPAELSMPVALGENCVSAVICCETEQLFMSEISVYSAGTLPENVPVMSPSIEKTDMLIITTHPDDEWLFLGAVYPIFCREQGHTGTFAYITTPSWGRLHEALNGLYSAGVRNFPYFLGFKDIDRSAPEAQKAEFTEEAVVLSLVRLFRRVRPLVVVTQDPVKGEYGHWQHILGANAAFKAVTLAGDPSYDPETAEEYGVWSPLKLYQHMITDNGIVLDCTSPLSSYGGQNALSVAKAAYKYHKSQQRYSFTPSVKAGNYGDLRLYGLTYSAVGPDTGNDMFENIPAELLCAAKDQ